MSCKLMWSIVSYVLLCGPALAQHAGDVAVGHTAAGKLTIGPLENSWHPLTQTQLLTKVIDEGVVSYRAVNPGFDSNFATDETSDFYQLDSNADIWVVADQDMSPAFTAEWGGITVEFAGDEIPLGGQGLHKHIRFILDASQSPPYDEVRVHWSGTFRLTDQGGTSYSDSDPFTLYFSPYKCVLGDANGDGLVDFNDIDDFVTTLIDPESADAVTRCAADTNRDGYVTFEDIDSFVALLIG